MDHPVQSSDGIPLPRFRTMLLVAAVALGAWIVWSIVESVRARHALMDPGAPPLRRVQAIDRWASLGREAIPELTEALKSQDVKTRQLALFALTRIGPDARGTGPEVARLLADPSERIRAAALQTLREIDYPMEQELPAIVALLSAEDGSLRSEAAGVLDGIGAPAIPRLCDVIDSPKPEARRQAAALLGRLGEDDPQANAALDRAAAAADDQVRGLAYRILISWNELTLDEAITGLRDANGKIASDVAMGVDRLGEGAEVLVPNLIRLLDRTDTKHAALQGLWALGPAAESAIAPVLDLLETETRPELLLDVLGRIAAGKAELAPHVTPFLVERSPYGYVSERAGQALARISPEAARAAVPDLVQYLDGADSGRRQRAAAALDGLGSEARDALPALIEALTGPDGWVRFHAARTLGEIGPQAAAAESHLIALAKDRSLSKRDERGFKGVDGMAREAAVRALGMIGTETEAAASALVQALPDEDEAIRAEAALALGRLQPDPATVVPALESVLLDDSALARKAAAIALGQYGPHASSAVPILVAMANEEGEPPPLRSVASPADEPFRIESRWQQSYQDGFPLARLYRRSVASFANEALRKIKPDALKHAGIHPDARANLAKFDSPVPGRSRNRSY